jgi:putative glutamine amidotransferase
VDDAEPGRDEFEIDLARRARDADLPILAICRGAQVLNVASGGSLVQDIPSAIETALPHSIQNPKDAVAHDVRVTPGSRLAQALGTR